MRPDYRLLLLFVLAVVLAGILFTRRDAVVSQSNPAPSLAADAVSLRVQFGIADTAPRAWDGSVSVSGGEIASVRNWHPRPGDKVEGHNWSLTTRPGVNFTLRAWEKQRLAPPEKYPLVPGVIVDVNGSAAHLSFSTKNGNFDVNVSAFQPGRPLAFLGGAVLVDLVPSVQPISDPALNSEFATLAAGPGSELWAAWVVYRSGRNAVVARRYNGSTWEAPQTVSGDHGDIFFVHSARGRGNGIWFVWSAQVNGNWDIYARRWDGKAWSSIERLTSDPEPDIYHAVAVDSGGDVWVAWQGFRGGRSDIFVRRYDGASWAAEERVSTSSANDWNPALAADSQGRLYVAWDSYDQGNYDIFFRRFENGRWSGVSPIAGTGKYEAYVSLACDRQDRLWAAWNESGYEWGKDTGYIPKLEGTPLYEWRKLAVAVWSPAGWQQPAASVEASLPTDLQGYNDIPQLAADASGRIWLFFRHRLLRIKDTPASTPAHRAAWEVHAVSYETDRWSTPLHFPFSNTRQNIRSAFAASQGALYAVFPTDHRDYEDFLYQRAQVNIARLPASTAAVAEPKLQPRPEADLKALNVIHPNERADLDRIHAHVMRNGPSAYKIYRGDTHRHTEFSMDGNNDGSLLDTYRYAIDAAELDYLMVSEHNGLGGPDNEYPNWLLQQMADVFTIPGKFLPLYGYERSVPYPNGHRNVIFARRGNPALPIPEEEQKAQTGAKALYEYLKKYGGIAISHTSASTMGTDWRDNDPEVEPLVEIYQGDRVSNEYEGAPKAAYTGNPASAPGGFRPAGYVWNAWAKGYKLGVQVSSDHLSTHISYACTLAPEFTRQALLDAMKARRSYGATDNIVLDYRLLAGGKEYMQGEIVPVTGPFQLKVHAVGTRPIRQVDVIRSNRFVSTSHPMTDKVEFTFQDAQPLSGESYYYVRLQQVDDQMAWSSPIWIKR